MKHERPADIERTSMAIITQELADLGIELPPDEAPVIKRVIHTSADLDYAKNLVFTPNAVRLATDALRRGGQTIITDTNMAKAGVSRVGLEKLGGQVLCFMADPDIAQRAKEQGSTRAVAAMQKAAQAYPGAILAVGNAPTALFEIVRQMERGLRPALVIGVPVGFVNVVEAKETVLAACRTYDVPAIVALGRKGGATWPPPSATPWSTGRGTCWTPRPVGGSKAQNLTKKQGRGPVMGCVPVLSLL